MGKIGENGVDLRQAMQGLKVVLAALKMMPLLAF
jgi:hypothetical protein